MGAAFRGLIGSKMTVKKANLLLLFAAFVWGSGFVGNAWVLGAGFSPLQLIAARMFIASACLCVFFRKNLKTITKTEIVAGSLLGGLLLAGFIFQTYALLYITASVNAFVTSVYVILTPFFRRMIIKEKLDYFANIGAGLTIVGIAFISLDGGFGMSIGVVLTLICAVFYALQTVFTDKFTKIYSPINLTIVMITFNAIFANAASVIIYDRPQMSGAVALSLLYLGLVCTFAAYLAQNIGQKYTTAVNAAIIMSMESVFGTILAVIILGDMLSTQMILGMSIVFVAIIVAETKLEFIKKKNSKEDLDNGKG